MSGKVIDIPSPLGLAGLDQSTRTLQTIEYEHHEVHSGSHFNYSVYDVSMASGAQLEFIITTPNTTKWAHAIFTGVSSFKSIFSLFEDTTHTPGAQLIGYNNNRNSANSYTVSLTANGGGGADGTAIEQLSVGYSTGGGAAVQLGGGTGRSDNEWVLKQNAKYLVQAESLKDGNNITIAMAWYEHTNK